MLRHLIQHVADVVLIALDELAPLLYDGLFLKDGPRLFCLAVESLHEGIRGGLGWFSISGTILALFGRLAGGRRFATRRLNVLLHCWITIHLLIVFTHHLIKVAQVGVQ